jgi:hypothetical protein
MSFCSLCGQQIQEEGSHVCQEIAAARSEGFSGRPVMEDLSAAVKQVDSKILINLLKNPQNSLALNPSRDLVYGLLGIVASIVGFVIWAWIIQKQVQDLLDSIFGGFSLFSGIEHSVSNLIVGKLFLTGLISLAAIFVSLWLFGNRRGNRKLSFKEAIIHLGAMQYTSGACFIITGIIILINFKLGLLFLLINLLVTLLSTVTGSIDLFEVSKENRFPFIVLSTSLYLVLVFFLAISLF